MDLRGKHPSHVCHDVSKTSIDFNPRLSRLILQGPIDTIFQNQGYLFISQTAPNYITGVSMSVEKVIGKLSHNNRKALTAVMLVGIMLFSTQMYSFQDFETYDEKSSIRGESSDREPFQQSGQAQWPSNEISQPTQAHQQFFNHPAFTDPSFHDQMSYYGKVSDPSALMMQPEYSFFLEETDAEDTTTTVLAI